MTASIPLHIFSCCAVLSSGHYCSSLPPLWQVRLSGFHPPPALSKEQEKYTSSIDLTMRVCYNFPVLRNEPRKRFDDGDKLMNAMMLLGIQAVLISLLVRLITYPYAAKSLALQCQH